MEYPKKVKFIGNKEENVLYKVGLRINEKYYTVLDDDAVEAFKEEGVVTVMDDDGHGHEIEKGDFEVVSN